MKKSDLEKPVREKVLLVGISGVGKTNISLKIAKLYAIAGKTVLYIDPEDGTDRDIKNIFNDLSDEELSRITIEHANNIEFYIKLMYGLREEVKIGSEQSIFKTSYINYDLKVCDGLTTEMDLFKTKLTRKCIDQGFYEIGGKKFDIKNSDTFVLPYQFYAKLYDQVVEAIYVMLEHKYDLLCTTHPFKNTDAQQYLKENIYKKFDSVIKFNKNIDFEGLPMWDGIVIKNRGRESVDKSNVLPSTDLLLMYYIKKFNMDMNKVGERVGIKIEKE